MVEHLTVDQVVAGSTPVAHPCFPLTLAPLPLGEGIFLPQEVIHKRKDKGKFRPALDY